MLPHLQGLCHETVEALPEGRSNVLYSIVCLVGVKPLLGPWNGVTVKLSQLYADALRDGTPPFHSLLPPQKDRARALPHSTASPLSESHRKCGTPQSDSRAGLHLKGQRVTWLSVIKLISVCLWGL